MQRPVMDPMFLREQPESRRHARIAALLAKIVRVLRWGGRKLLSQPIHLRRRRAPHEQDSLFSRFLRGATYRLLFLPILMTGASAAFVYSGTHPAADIAEVDPRAAGVFHESITFQSDDGTPLNAWFIPQVNARRVILQRDRLLRERHPAMVLAHDFGRSPRQMLPLLAPLHEDGCLVLVVGLRGVGAGRIRGQTFGINESLDLTAAVRMLRARPFVDPDRIALLGIGTGANAALLTAQRDPKIAALVLADAMPTPDEAISRRLGPDAWGMGWLRLMNKWTFQVAYHVDLDDMNMNRADSLTPARPILKLTGRQGPEGELHPTAVQEIRAFCQATLKKGTKTDLARPVVALTP